MICNVSPDHTLPESLKQNKTKQNKTKQKTKQNKTKQKTHFRQFHHIGGFARTMTMK